MAYFRGERSLNEREVAVTGQPSAVCRPLLLLVVVQT
jgi:hypothetical protein